jgi:molybdopterin molybdotransferase
MIAFDEAVRLVASVARPLGTEQVGLGMAQGRVLAAPVLACVDSPPANVSAMDGYAVRAADVAAPPVELRVVGQSLPGAGFAGDIAAGAAVRIFTGAPVPAGCDRVVIQENVRRDGAMAFIADAGTGTNIRARGSDFRSGETLLDPGVLLRPGALVAAAAADCGTLLVHRRPRLRLVATGDELAQPGAARARPGAIPESVSFGVLALARDWGAETLGRLRLADDLAAMRDEADVALDGADVLVVTGGASVGERDFAKAMFGDALDLVFSKVAIKPGKPVWLGRAGGTLVIGLPGNPTSAMVTARLFLAPLLAGLGGRDPAEALRWRTAPLAAPLGPTGERETFARACREGDAVRPLTNKDSGAQKMLAAADLLVRRRPGVAGYAAGVQVETLSF